MPQKVYEIFGGRGLVSNVSPHGSDPQGFTVFRDLVTDVARRIRKRPGIGAIFGTTLSGTTAMHEYVYTNPSTGAVDRYIIRASDTVIQHSKNGAAWTAPTLPITPTAGGLWVFENIGNRVLAVNGKDAPILFDGTSWQKVGVEGPSTAMGYTLGGTYSIGTVTATQGSPTVTGAVPAIWPTGSVWVSPYIDINGVRYQVSSIDVQGNGTTIASVLTLTENFKEATAPGLTYTIYKGACSWGDNPPRYAYAYFNSTTGHCSNIRDSSLTTENITEITEKNQVGRDITLTNIAYSAAAFLAGYDRIKIFRTPKDANILVALSTDIANANSGATTTFTETANTFVDTALTKFPAQRTKLRIPPTGLTSIRYHLGRAWGTKQNKLYFSLHEAEVTGELGVSEESWPSNYNRTVQRTKGLVTVGGTDGRAGTLAIQAESGNKSVAGFDQRDVFAFDLSTPEMASFPYGALGVQGSLLTFYLDKHLFEWPEGNDYGVAIQDKLNAVKDSLITGARLHRFKWQDRNVVLLSVPKSGASSANDYTYVYDPDREGWYEWNRGFAAFTTARDATTGALQLWATDSAGVTFQLLQAGQWQDSVANFQPTLTTANLRPFEEFNADLKFVDVYVNDASGSWTGELLIDEQTSGNGQSFQLSAARHADQSAQGRKLRWRPSTSVRTRGVNFQIALTMPAQNAELIIEKIVIAFEQGDAIETTNFA